MGLLGLGYYGKFFHKKAFCYGGYYLLLDGCRDCVIGMDFASITEGFTQHFEYSLDSLFIVYHKMIVLLLISPYGSHVCMGFSRSIVPLVAVLWPV